MSEWSFEKISSKYLHSWTVTARERTFLEKVHLLLLPPPDNCYVSHVTCHVSGVTCHMLFIFFFHTKWFRQVSNVFYQRGLPSLVINRPGVARAVLQTPLSLIDSSSYQVILFLQIFKTSLHPNHNSWNLKEYSPPTMCHMSDAMCQVSCVTFLFYFFLLKKKKKSVTCNFF